MAFDPPRRRRRRRQLTWAGLLAAVIAALATRFATDGQRKPGQQQNVSGQFSFYLLDMTYQAAWCELGNRALRQCRILDRETAARQPLVLHGLWPEFDAPGAYPTNCGARNPQLSHRVRERLGPVMPGMDVDLHIHEWRKHGTCTGLDADTYFGESIRWYERAATALAEPLRQSNGQVVAGGALRAAVRKTDAALADSLQFLCKNRRAADGQDRPRPWLVSVRLCIDNDGPDGRPQSLLNCQQIRRRDQGCGSSFFVDDI
jgi:ribonuclease T2